ncbi:MAG: galactokinase [Spirochaetes bacterium]|nr:galactokinase [Spirochaetota bacterium]
MPKGAGKGVGPQRTFDDTIAELYGGAEDVQRKRWERLARTATETYGSGDWRLFSSPGRTELGGNHTDHNHGRVLCASIQLDSIACVRPRGDNAAVVRSEGWDAPFIVDLSSLAPVSAERGTTAALIRGVAAGLAKSGRPVGGFEACMSSTVFPGSGLSSSASVEVLFGAILSGLHAGGKVPWVDLAKIGQYAENIFFGKPCGLMDQMACASGGIITIDFADPARPGWRRIDYDFARSGFELAVVNTGGSHADLTGDYAAIPSEMKAVARLFGRETLRGIDEGRILAKAPLIREECGDRALLRALHFADENERVPAMVEALESGRPKRYLKLVRASGASSRGMLQNVTAGHDPGEQGMALGISLSERFLGRDGAVRVHGGGFAGTIQAYVPRGRMAGWTTLMESVFGRGCVTPLRIRPVGAVEIPHP